MNESASLLAEPQRPPSGGESLAPSRLEHAPCHAPCALLPGWAAILLLAFIWRLMGITTNEVWRDEATTLIQAKGSWLDLLLELPFAEDTPPPLGFLLFKAWTSLSDLEWFIRLLPVLLGTAWVCRRAG